MPETPDRDRKKLRWLRLLSISLFVLPVLGYVLLYWGMEWHASSSWSRIERQMKAEGETLEFMSLTPKPVPDADNFFAIEPLKDLALIVDGDIDKGEPATRRKRLMGLEMNHPPWKKRDETDRPPGIKYAVPWKASDWDEFLMNVPRMELTGNHAHDLMRFLDREADLYTHLHSGLGRPISVVTPDWTVRQRNGISAADFHASSYADVQLGRRMALHAQAAVACGQYHQAVQDILVLMRMAGGQGKEPVLGGSMSAVSGARDAVEACWSLLLAEARDERDLKSVIQAFENCDLAHILSTGTRGALIAYLDRIDTPYDRPNPRNSSPSMNWYGWNNLGLTMGQLEEFIWHWTRTGMRKVNAGAFASSDKARGFNTLYRWQLQPLRKDGLRGWSDKWMQTRDGRDWRDIWVMVGNAGDHRWMYGAFLKPVVAETLKAQVRLHQARIACALELYWLTNREYPDRLSQLVPGFLSFLPPDLCDGKPMRYARTKLGRYKLWSVAIDKLDDNGDLVPRLDYPYGLHTAHDCVGDWVWTYEPLPSKP